MQAKDYYPIEHIVSVINIPATGSWVVAVVGGGGVFTL